MAYRSIKEQGPGALSVNMSANTTDKPTETKSRPSGYSREGVSLRGGTPVPMGEPIVEMHDVVVKYGDKTVLGNWQDTVNGETRHGLHWTVRRGQRWGVFGPNGNHPSSPASSFLQFTLLISYS